MANFNWSRFKQDDNARRPFPQPRVVPDPDRFKKSDEEIGWLVVVPNGCGGWRPFYGPTLSETSARQNCPKDGELRSSVELGRQAKAAHKKR